MTPEEREAYVGQDEVKRGWREIPSSDRLERLETGETLADLFRPGGWLPEDGAILAVLDPVEAECLRLHHGEGKSYGQIARLLAHVWLSGDNTLKRRPFTKSMVNKLIRSAKKKLLKQLEQKATRED